jgi:hypothetical protein
MLFVKKVFDILKKNVDKEILIPPAVAKRLQDEADAMRTPEEMRERAYSQMKRNASLRRKCFQ